MPRATVESRVAGLSTEADTEANAEQVISGVAVGPGDVTKGLSGDRKVWRADELEQAADSLAGGDLKALHSETVVGEVTDAGYVPDRGVVYQARIDDDEIADSIANGRLTVSVEARHDDGGTVDTDRGDAMSVTDIEFSDLAIVQHGAAPSASADPGEAAALSPAEIRSLLEDDDPASTEGNPEDIDISDSVEEGLENKVEEHNEEVDSEAKEVTLGQLKKVFRRGAGAWFSSSKGATQQQWAYARVNEALSDIKNEKAINHGNDNDIFEDSLDYNPPDEEQSASAALVEVNGTEVDLEAPAKVKNAIEAAMDAKDEYSDVIGDCGTGVGEEMGQTILDDALTPEIVTSGGSIAQYGPSTYLDGHGDEGPATDDPPTDWGRTEWLGMESEDDDPRCGPVQLAMWGFYLEPFEEMKQAVEAAREDESMSEHESGADNVEIPDKYRFTNPGEAVEAAQFLKIGEGRDLAGDEMIHTMDDDGETVFMPGETHEQLIEVLREQDELAEHHDGGADVRLPFPSEQVQLLYPEQSVAADAAEAMGLNGTHEHDFEGETWYMPGETHGDFVAVVGDMDAGLGGVAPVARLNEYQTVGPVDFRGVRTGELDESAIPDDDYKGHYLIEGSSKSESSYPVVDSEGYLRRGNLDAAWNLRGQGDYDMPRETFERMVLTMGRIFGPPESEANPISAGSYDEFEGNTGTPYAADEPAVELAARLSTVTENETDEPAQGEVSAVDADTTTRTMTENTHSDTDPDADSDAQLGGHLADMMRGKMTEHMMGHGKKKSEMMDEMAQAGGCSHGHMRSIMRGDVGCPSQDIIEGMAETLDMDPEMVMRAAERDGCDYGMMSGHDMEKDEEQMTTTDELKSELTDKRNRIEQLEQRVDELEAEREQVAAEYAEALAADSDVLDAETMTEKFAVAELAEMYDEQSASVTDDNPEPDVRGGDGAGGQAAELAPADRQRAQELEEQLSELEGHDSRLADARREEIETELAELRGE